MPKTYTPANRTVIFTGFREDVDISTIERFCKKSLSADPALISGLADPAISVTGGKVYINFTDCVKARKAITTLSAVSPDEVCSPGSHIEIWLKEKGRASSISSLTSKIPETAENSKSQSIVQDSAQDQQDENDDQENTDTAREFEVHLNESLVNEISGGKSFHEFAEDFASWNPDEETSREFKPQDIEELMRKIEQDDSTVQVLGFNEFPYSAGNKLKGNNREVEREYWLQLRNVDKRLAGEDNLAILHVHYQGKWHPVPHHRDRSIITQINIRHTTRTRAKAFHIKCADLNKWREKHGSSVVKQIPKSGWRWREDSTRCKPVHKVLIGAERCTKQVRSLDLRGLDARPTGQRRALIIAVKSYDSEQIPNLANAIQDGSKLEGALEQLGWDVSFETNLDLERAEAAVSDFAELVGDNSDACLFAFVGHGLEVRGKQYFVPRDARLGEREYTSHDDFEDAVRRRCMSFDYVRQRLKERRDSSEPTLFVLDCCRNDFWSVRGSQTRAISVDVDRAAVPVACDVDNSIVVFSTTSGSTAADGVAGRGGPFMGAFVEEAMREGRDLDEALAMTRKRVRDAASGCQLAPSTSLLYGKFYFHPGPHSAEAAPASRDAAAAPTADGGVLERIVNEDAREFWREYFHTDEEVTWSSFRPALLAEYPDLSPAALEHIKGKMDHDGDGRIHAREFNIFTKRAGLAASIAEAAREHPPEPAEGGAPRGANGSGDSESQPTTPAPREEATEPVAADDPLRPVVDIGSAAITYVGTGALLGGQKLRQGTVELNGCWVTVLRERGDAKDPIHVGECSVLRSDKIAAGRALEIIPTRGKNVVFALASSAERERWFEALAASRRLVDEARESNGTEGADPRFAEIVGELAPMGRLQLLCTGGDRQYGRSDIAHARCSRPLDAAKPYFEVLVRALPRGSCASIGVTPGGGRRPSLGHVGWFVGEVGLHVDGEMHTGPQSASQLVAHLRVGDRMGCGVLFDAAGGKQRVFFTVNGEMVGSAPYTAISAPQHPIIALAGKALRLEVILGLPAPTGAAAYERRCRVEGPGRAAAAEFGSLAEAVIAATDGETVSLEAGKYLLNQTLVVQHGVAIRALKHGTVEICKQGGGVAVACQAEGVVLAGVHVTCVGGDVRASFSEPNSACAVVVRSGACTLEGCTLVCPAGTGATIIGRVSFAAGCSIGPCGRHGVVSFKGGSAVLDGVLIEKCKMWCMVLNCGSRAELSGCTLASAYGVTVKATTGDGESASTSLSIAGTKLTSTSAAPCGRGLAVLGQDLAVSVIGCSLVGFETAVEACGRGTKVSLRDCEVNECDCGFCSREESVVVRVDCRLDKVKKAEASTSGGRVLDV